MAANRLQTLNVGDFRGGINLRADAFQLAENEVQLCLNVEIDARGGFRSRKGWEQWGDTSGEPDWDPRAMCAQVFGTTEKVMVANKASYTGGGATKGTVLESDDGTFTPILVGANPLVCGAEPHMADFAQWGDLVYIACGHDEQTAKWTGTGAATLATAAAAANWSPDYTAPGTAVFPKADIVATHFGYMFAASTNEDSTDYPHRVRWSHPNDPEHWAELDRLDIRTGGSRITALVSFADHLLIFKTDSIWRLDGYDSDSFQLSNVSLRLGAPHRQAVAVAEDRVYFFSYPHGVYEYAESGLFEVSEQLRPGITSDGFNGAALNNVWLAYVGQRLWANVPFSLTTSPSDAYTSLVLDRTLSERGSWVAFRGAGDVTVGPMVETLTSDQVYAAVRGLETVVALEALEDAVDDLAGTETAFVSYLETRWFDAGWPTRKKSWRRPDFIVKDTESTHIIQVGVFQDFDESTPKKAFPLNIPQRTSGFVWDDFVWDDGSLWGGQVAGSRPIRGNAFGLCSSVRLRFDGPSGLRWGVDAFVLKYILKRLK
jgi:hypothetical protein